MTLNARSHRYQHKKVLAFLKSMTGSTKRFRHQEGWIRGSFDSWQQQLEGRFKLDFCLSFIFFLSFTFHFLLSLNSTRMSTWQHLIPCQPLTAKFLTVRFYKLKNSIKQKWNVCKKKKRKHFRNIMMSEKKLQANKH